MSRWIEAPARIGIGCLVAVVGISCGEGGSNDSSDVVSLAVAAQSRAEHASGSICPDHPSSYFIDVVTDGGANRLASSCANVTEDFGAVGAVGGPFMQNFGVTGPQVLIESCSDRARRATKISILMIPAVERAFVYYRDPSGVVYYFSEFSESVDMPSLRVGPLGAAIEGTYQAIIGNEVQPGPTIAGSFRVCHLQDVTLPSRP